LSRSPSAVDADNPDAEHGRGLAAARGLEADTHLLLSSNELARNRYSTSKKRDSLFSRIVCSPTRWSSTRISNVRVRRVSLL